MFDNYVFTEGTCRNITEGDKVIGFELKTLITYYRGIPCSMIHDIKVKDDVRICKAFRLERLIKGILRRGAAVYRQKHLPAGRILPKGHIVPQPAFHPAALVIIGAGAFRRVLFTALKAVDIELPHIVADPLEAFDQLTV